MIIERTAKDTLTAVEMDIGDELRFTLADGQTRSIILQHTSARVVETTVDEPRVEKAGAVTNYEFNAIFTIDGHWFSMTRRNSYQQSFYEPREFADMRIWLDAVDSIFDFLTETHGECRPKKKVRFAIQDAALGICPVLLHPWCPLPAGGLRIEDCYNGEDVWMGAYFGASAHGGLDINHPAGTPIWAPIPLDDHWLYDRVDGGANNNRWRGEHTWAGGATWVLQLCHLIRLRVPEHEPVAAGTHLADGAGVWVGSHEHSHFIFRVRDYDDEIMLDPWILFRQMYRDRARTTAVD